MDQVTMAPEDSVYRGEDLNQANETVDRVCVLLSPEE